MKPTRFTAEQIGAIVHEAATGGVVRELRPNTASPRPRSIAGIGTTAGSVNETKRLKALEEENRRLKRLVAALSRGMDFIHNACAEGRRFRCLSMVDEYTLECPVTAVGPEFISRASDLWPCRRGIELVFFRSGNPVENASVESFHSRFRDECLSTHWFETLTDARFQIERWRQDYNEVRPHTSLSGRTPSEFAGMLKEQHTLTRLSA